MRHLTYLEMTSINTDISNNLSSEEIIKKYEVDETSIELVKVLISGKSSEMITLGHNRSLQKYIVGVKPRTAEWARDVSHQQLCPKINKARELYQDGRVEMVTEQTEDFTILYAIPRRLPRARNTYFELQNEKED